MLLIYNYYTKGTVAKSIKSYLMEVDKTAF